MAVTRTGLMVLDPLDIINEQRLKRDLLLVDGIAIDDRQLDLVRSYAELLCTLHDKDPMPLLRRFDQGLDYLCDQGKVFEAPIRDTPLPVKLQKRVNGIEGHAKRALEKKQPQQQILADGSKIVVDPAGSFVINKTRADFLRARHLATELSSNAVHYIPFASGLTQRLFDRSEGSMDRKETVLRLVLTNLPVPAADTTWDDILAFKANVDTQAQLAKLRGWMADMAVSQLDPQQVQDKLEDALSDYRRQMKSHQIKAEIGAIEIIATATADILGDLTRLQLGNAVKSLFGLFKEDHSLLEAELNSPGRELAFIDAAFSQLRPVN